MKCPQCKYESGQTAPAAGLKGSFYFSRVSLQRNNINSAECNQIVGCPKCGTVFITVR